MSSGRNRIVLLLLLAAIVAWLIDIAGGWRQVIIEPGALTLWLGWRVLVSLPQSVYWSVVILLAALPLFQLARIRSREDFRSAYQSESEPASRVDQWRITIQRASLGRQERNTLERSLARLISDSKQSGNRTGQLQLQADPDLMGLTQGQDLRQSTKYLEQFEVQIGGFILPITPPDRLKPIFARLIQPNYSDIKKYLHKVEMEMDIGHGSERTTTNNHR